MYIHTHVPSHVTPKHIFVVAYFYIHVQVSNAHGWHGDRKLARANEQEEQKQKQMQKQKEEAKQQRKQQKSKKRQQQQKQAKQREQQNGGGETRVSTLSSSGARSGANAKVRVYTPT